MGAKVAKSISVEVEINMEGGIFWNKNDVEPFHDRELEKFVYKFRGNNTYII